MNDAQSSFMRRCLLGTLITNESKEMVHWAKRRAYTVTRNGKFKLTRHGQRAIGITQTAVNVNDYISGKAVLRKPSIFEGLS